MVVEDDRVVGGLPRRVVSPGGGHEGGGVAATADAAEPPMPEASGMPLSMSSSNPKSNFSAACSA